MRPKGSQFVAFTIAADEPASDLAGRLKSSSIGLSWKDSLQQEGQGELTVVGLEALEEAPLPIFTVGKEARVGRCLPHHKQLWLWGPHCMFVCYPPCLQEGVSTSVHPCPRKAMP
jgi:hypothetical protein